MQKQWYKEIVHIKIIKEFSPPDPVFQTDHGWFFYDETWTECFGPFDTEEACRKCLISYAESL